MAVVWEKLAQALFYPQRREVWAGAALVFLALAALAWTSNRNGLFYDDEIFTINLLMAQDSVIGVIRAANSADLHPPLAYAIDFLLYQMTGDWKAVQLVVGLVNAAALTAFSAMAHRALPRTAWLILVGLLASCATSIMWGASLRWYGWFNPIFAIALATALWGRLKPAASFAVLTSLSVVLFHIGYLAGIACPLLGLAWMMRYRRQIDRKALVAGLVMVLVALIVCLPQLNALIRVHLEYPIESQVGSLGMALVQTAITITIGNAVLPLGLLPIAAALLFGAVMLLSLRQLRIASPLAGLWLVVILGAAAMVLSGLGYRPRNSFFLTIAALPLLASALAALPLPSRIAALALTAALQLQGVYNVAVHQGTAKRSFNTPYREIIAAMDRMALDCREVVLMHNDDVLHYLTRQRYRQPFRTAKTPQQLQAGDCILLERGPANELADATMAKLRASLGQMPVVLESEQKFAPEPQLALAASLIGETVGDHAAVVTKYRLLKPARIMIDGD